jgi:exonuclease III
MDHNRKWNFLAWNVRGINSQTKWDAIRDKIKECHCSVICLQETKREHFDSNYIKKFCPRQLDAFEFSPSVGASGGLITIWNSNLFDGQLVSSNGYSVIVKLTSRLYAQSFHITNIYGPAATADKLGFISWLYNFDTSGFEDWLLLGDFNLIRSAENRNRPGGNSSEMMLFNDLIQHLDLVEIDFQGRSFTWSNMQDNALLEKLDWVFTSASWSLAFPDTKAFPLARPVSDHIPYAVQIGTELPHSSVFRFENYWVDFDGFHDTVLLHWETTPFYCNAARTLNAKFKQLRRGLKSWSISISKLNTTIHNCSWVIALLDGLEETRSLSRPEKNFRKIIRCHLAKLLEAKRIYWKQRATIRFVQLGDENTKLFQAMATHTNRKNNISQLFLENGDCLSQHADKAEALLCSFKDRLGRSEFSEIHYDLDQIVSSVQLPILDTPFIADEIKTALEDVPIDHAPGPGGFNGMVLKKCCPIIEHDFLRLFVLGTELSLSSRGRMTLGVEEIF